jgi:hypothetical protein
MANLEKHKKNAAQEWLDGEESTVPVRSRGSHVVGAYIKMSKTVARKARRAPLNGHTEKVDPALVREPAPPPKIEAKHSQANSPDHQRRVQRLPNLRQPYTPNRGKSR